jgi:hypothetical protein
MATTTVLWHLEERPDGDQSSVQVTHRLIHDRPEALSLAMGPAGDGRKLSHSVPKYLGFPDFRRKVSGRRGLNLDDLNKRLG